MFSITCNHESFHLSPIQMQKYVPPTHPPLKFDSNHVAHFLDDRLTVGLEMLMLEGSQMWNLFQFTSGKE